MVMSFDARFATLGKLMSGSWWLRKDRKVTVQERAVPNYLESQHDS